MATKIPRQKPLPAVIKTQSSTQSPSPKINSGIGEVIYAYGTQSINKNSKRMDWALIQLIAPFKFRTNFPPVGYLGDYDY